jgi:hypothetical protein
MRYVLFLLLLCNPFNADAQQLPKALTDFSGYSDILPPDTQGHERVAQKISPDHDIIPRIKSKITDAAITNLSSPEQVFCYRIAPKPKDYNGYTLNNYAILNYCGELDEDLSATVFEALLTRGSNILPDKADVPHSPRFMIRFTRGVDSADIMLSSSEDGAFFIIFYGGKLARFFVKQNIANEIIKKLNKTEQDFYSPTLLKQTVANGTPSTTEEQAKIAKQKKVETPIRNWQTEPETLSEPQKNFSGWGKNFKIKK